MPVTKQVFTLGLFYASLVSAQSANDRGIEAFLHGKYSEAIATLQTARDDTGQAFYALAEAGANQCKTALPGLTRTHNDPVLSRLTGLAAVKCYISADDTASAARLLHDLQRRFPNDADVLYTAAQFHMQAFNATTLAMFQRAPASYRVHELSAEIFEVESRWADAVAEYRKAIELNPQAPDLHFRLGRALLLQSHDPKALDQAAVAFEAEHKLSPEDSATEFQLGQIAQVQDRNTEARAHLERALQLSPDFAAALIALGKIESHEKHYERAVALLSRATQAQPNSESARYALMTAYRDSGRMKEAREQKVILDRMQKPPEGEFSNFLKKLGEKPVEQ